MPKLYSTAIRVHLFSIVQSLLQLPQFVQVFNQQPNHVMCDLQLKQLTPGLPL